MDILLSYIPWQIQVLILIIVVLLIILNIKKIPKTVPKTAMVGFFTFILTGINLIFILLGENMGDSIGIKPKHVDILHIINWIFTVLSISLIFIGAYQKVKHDEKERKYVLKEIRGVIISFIIFIIVILLGILVRYLE